MVVVVGYCGKNLARNPYEISTLVDNVGIYFRLGKPSNVPTTRTSIGRKE